MFDCFLFIGNFTCCLQLPASSCLFLSLLSLEKHSWDWCCKLPSSSKVLELQLNIYRSPCSSSEDLQRKVSSGHQDQMLQSKHLTRETHFRIFFSQSCSFCHYPMITTMGEVWKVSGKAPQVLLGRSYFTSNAAQIQSSRLYSSGKLAWSGEGYGPRKPTEPHRLQRAEKLWAEVQTPSWPKQTRRQCLVISRDKSIYSTGEKVNLVSGDEPPDSQQQRFHGQCENISASQRIHIITINSMRTSLLR